MTDTYVNQTINKVIGHKGTLPQRSAMGEGVKYKKDLSQYGYGFLFVDKTMFNYEGFLYDGQVAICSVTDLKVLREQSFHNGSLHIPKAIRDDGNRSDRKWYLVVAVLDHFACRAPFGFWKDIFPDKVSLTVPDSMVYIGREAFYGIPFTGDLNVSTVPYIGERAFLGSNIATAYIAPSNNGAKDVFPSSTSVINVDRKSNKILDSILHACNRRII